MPPCEIETMHLIYANLMKLNRVLIVYKRKRKPSPHGQHENALYIVRAVLDSFGISHETIEREKLCDGLSCDMVVTVGGDGTFLAAGHASSAGKKCVPVLGVNSMPHSSVGFFCHTFADGFEIAVKKILKGMQPKKLSLLEARVSGKLLPMKAINDILFTRSCPAEMTRFTITIGRRSEYQRSSGIWFSSGPGSTAATGSAGGKKLSFLSDKLQYVVREPYELRDRTFKLKKGVLSASTSILIVPERDACVYMDGHHVSYDVKEGEKLEVKISKQKLLAFV